jgi:predicted nuclease of predicted toxin-antitoxin system
MQLLADENFPRASVLRLRVERESVEWVAEFSPGLSDTEVLAHARERHQVLLTFDRDFGELIYRQAAPAPAGVVHFRFIPTTPEEPAVVLRQLLAVKGLDLIGRYTVVERDRVRQRPLLRSR